MNKIIAYLEAFYKTAKGQQCTLCVKTILDRVKVIAGTDRYTSPYTDTRDVHGPKTSTLSSLQGVGKELWEGQDAQEYLNEERGISIVKVKDIAEKEKPICFGNLSDGEKYADKINTATPSRLIEELKKYCIEHDHLDACNCHVVYSVGLMDILSRYSAHEPVKAESLAELADRKGYWKTKTTHEIDLWHIRSWNGKVHTEWFHGVTLVEAESMFRRYLEGLKDVEAIHHKTS